MDAIRARPPAAGRDHGRRRPNTHEAWQVEYTRRMDAYLGLGYSLEEIQALHLFRALDPSGDVIDQTRRLIRDVAYVCNVDARALAGGGLTLEVNPALGWSDAQVERWQAEGDAVWQRSRVRNHAERWALNLAVFGDGHYEAMSREGGTVIVGHAPQHVIVQYDNHNIDVSEVVIDLPWFEGATVDPATGRVSHGDSALHEYVRRMDGARIQTWQDGAIVAAGTGANPLGVVPLVHVPFAPFGEPDHGLWAAEGYDDAIALADSLLTMLAAVGNRHAFPWVWTRGFKVGAGTDVGQFSRIISGIPVEGELGALEPSLSGLTAILDAVTRHLEHLRATLPEFTLQAASSAASGEALRVHASALIAKIEPIRTRWYRALARVTAMAVAMQLGERWRPELDDAFRVTGGPIVPLDKTAELTRIHEVLGREGMTRADYTRHLQTLGYVDTEEDPEEYAVRAMADSLGHLEAMGDAAMRGLGEAPPDGGNAAEDAAGEDAGNAAEDETDRNA